MPFEVGVGFEVLGQHVTGERQLFDIDVLEHLPGLDVVGFLEELRCKLTHIQVSHDEGILGIEFVSQVLKPDHYLILGQWDGSVDEHFIRTVIDHVIQSHL